MDRTEEQILARAPLTVVLGGEEYSVRMLVLTESRQWRADAAKLLASLPKLDNVDIADPEQFGEAIGLLMNVMPDTICDLFFKYAKDLDRDKIGAVATDLELVAAFKVVSAVAFPFVQSATELAEKVIPETPSL